MTRDGDGRRRSMAAARNTAHHASSGRRGRGRGTTSHRSSSRHDDRASRSHEMPPRTRATNPPSRGGRRSPHVATTRGRRGGWLHVLPEDILAQSLLPFLVWHETSALACGAKSLALAVRLARHQHAQYETTRCTGDSARACVRVMTQQLGRNGPRALRFAPNFAMATLAFASLQDARDAQAVWSELVDAVVAADVLPVGCELVGMLDGGDSTRGTNRRAPGDDVESAAVTLTISIGHFPRTDVESAAFDRKALRWSASGLSEELECPFEESSPTGTDKTSLFLWSTSAKPAQVLLTLATQWYPGAAVAGGVLARADHAPSLMTFTRAATTAARKSKRKMKTLTRPPRGVLSFPSTLLVRLQGRTFIESLKLVLDRPLTPILKNEAMGTDDFEFMRHDIRTYESVSIIDGTRDGSETQSLDAIVDYYAQNLRDEGGGGHMNVMAATASKVLRCSGIHERDEELEEQSLDVVGEIESVRSIPLFFDRRGVLTVGDHWRVGEFGVVTVRKDQEELIPAVQAQIEQVLLSLHNASATPMASMILCSTDVGTVFDDSVEQTLIRSLCGMPVHHVFVDGEIGPVSADVALRVYPVRLQTRSVCGFVLCHSH